MAQIVPYNLEAEQAILGSVLIDNEIAVRLSDEIQISDFYDRRHQIIYQAMIGLYNENIKIDFTTLISALQMKNQLEEAGGAIYLGSLMEAVYTTANIDDYINIVTDSALKRNVIAASKSISDAGYDPSYNSKDYVDYAEKIITDLAQRRKTDNLIPIKNVVSDVHKEILINKTGNRQVVGLPTGFQKLDEILLGLQRQQLIILAARPAMGKSAFAMNIALNVAKNMENDVKPVVAIFSFEMSQEQITQRMLASVAQVNLGNIQKGDLTQREMVYIQDACTELSDCDIYYSDSSLNTVADIRAKCRRLKGQVGLDLVVIDYLQLINTNSSRGQNRQEEIASISRALKQLARELDIPIIALSQLSREVDKRDDKHPLMADLRESGSIEQDADVILFLYRDSRYNKDTKYPNLAELTIAKNRSGGTGNGNLLFLFKGEYQYFSDYGETE